MWRIFIDTGGTFTDALGLSPGGRTFRAKVLSSGVLRARVVEVIDGRTVRLDEAWHAQDDLPRGWRMVMRGRDPAGSFEIAGYDSRSSTLRLAAPIKRQVPCGTMIEIESGEEAPIVAARLMTGTPGDRPLPPISMRLATTRGTNALLTGGVSPIALFITRGLGDLLEIGTQQRPAADLFALDIHQPRALHRCVVEVDERLNADGTVLKPPDLEALEGAARRALDQGFECAAVSLLHGDINPAHERAVVSCLRRLGFRVVCASGEVAPFVKLLPRAQTTVIEAALSPVVSDYFQRVSASLPGGRLDSLTSAGGLVPARAFRAKDSLLSGPAGGVVGAAAAAESAGEREIVAFDMGGTSTDVSRWAGRLEHVYEHTVADATLVAPAADVHTVAAGGGSVCDFDGAALVVGPASAGAEPGPACYGRDGPLTVTDAQLLSGRIWPSGIAVPLDVAGAERALAALAARMGNGGVLQDRGRVLDGLLAVAAERIAGAIRTVSTRRGHDPHAASLLAFGGAGGQIACMVAERLGMARVIIPPDAGLLSARGLAAARFERIAERQVLSPLAEVGEQLDDLVAELRDRAAGELSSTLAEIGEDPERIEHRAIAAVRVRGQETPLELTFGRSSDLAPAFDREFQRVFGYRPEGEGRDAGRELVWLRVVVSGGEPIGGFAPAGPEQRDASRIMGAQDLRSGGRSHRTEALHRDALHAGETIRGPALIVESHCTTVVDEGWDLTVLHDGSLRLDRVSDAARGAAGAGSGAGAIEEAEVELFTARMESIAVSMGEALRRTSFSVNVKERLDYSCAVLDARGRLVACAPHVPVHLGSLGVCVREVVRRTTIAQGDAVVTNHPACGGSHLPDVTVIGGAFDGDGRVIGYVAARAHHAEIGGIRPGSMPPNATRLGDEGVVIPPMHVVRSGVPDFAGLERVLSSGKHPTRALRANIEDIRAAIAACANGASEIEDLVAAHGAGRLGEMLEAIQRRSALAATGVARALGPIDLHLKDELDDGSPLCIRVVAAGDSLTLDFLGTAGVHPGNLNATPAIVNSCVLYVTRVLAGREQTNRAGRGLPLNEGLMRPVRLILPEGLLNPPFDPDLDPEVQPAVVGGNVETSQRLVNLLLRGLGVCAESQGTMNNLIFGDEERSYYETICGGAGAGPGFDGASAVHTHMTNTRITDPEVLERRYPVRLEKFAVRRGSGGAGKQCGGDGVERAIRFLAPMSLSLLTQRRVRGPRGGNGGGPGMPGEQWIERVDGRTERLKSLDSREVGSGDLVVVRTPGGGGWGSIPADAT